MILFYCCAECEDNEFPCDKERCIPMSGRCNGEFDCDDQTDEQHCPQVPTPDPSKWFFENYFSILPSIISPFAKAKL